MSTPEEPPQLTRRQLRELRNTAANPIIPAAPATGDAPVVAPLPRAAEPVRLPEQPTTPTGADAAGRGRVLTRREVRQRERLRTASVPVITADVLAAHAAEGEAEGAPDATPHVAAAAPEVAEATEHPDAVAVEPETPTGEAEAVTPEPEASADEADADTITPEAPAAASDAVRDETAVPAGEATTDKPVVAPELGADLLRGEVSEVEVPASFDQLLARGSSATGALSMPNALILSQTPESGPFVSPVNATGEVLITGTFSLPDRYGSTGSVPGTADGSDVDAVLIDGELPAASSPTPIAASAAISTIKSAEEIIRPPAPEKGSRLMIVLAITAGVLAVALAGVLIVAITTGVFS